MARRSFLASVAVLICVAIFLGCTRKFPWTKLEDVPTKVSISGNEFILEPFVYRDCMPGIGVQILPRALIASLTIKSVNSKPVPTDLNVEYMWVIYGRRVWKTRITEEPLRLSNELSAVARRGPRWKVGAPVDVVVRLAAPDGKKYLLRASNQRVQAVY